MSKLTMSTDLSLIYKQFFPPKPPLTEANLPDQTGKHFIVTGATSGVGILKFLHTRHTPSHPHRPLRSLHHRAGCEAV
ncbi:hypothetical protein M7I_3993 [Glarea lozoyensis 74030]|uniref:Uncharacterized protein n=1 Tax=Glarea lozoyensis (strain ATCC 74030 / MF5533) TaxID=1104152 RepID=H0EMZ4_GLAL7|nr:hypothetical protein M7I_3993 [Glarea lozoyensis 74030]